MHLPVYHDQGDCCSKWKGLEGEGAGPWLIYVAEGLPSEHCHLKMQKYCG